MRGAFSAKTLLELGSPRLEAARANATIFAHRRCSSIGGTKTSRIFDFGF